MLKTCTAPPFALHVFDLTSMINKVLYDKLNSTCILIGSFMYPYDLLENKNIGDITMH